LLFRDADHDGTPEFKEVFLSNLHQPFGMLILGDYFYVATVDALYRYPYKQGVTSLKTVPEKLVDFPTKGENRHWTRNLIAHPNENKIYIAIGSGTNIADEGIENEKRRACILEINPDGSGEKIYAYGLRNPVGMGWAPGTNTLWTAVNERDELGDDLVPDFLTSVKQGGFYGWPYSYFGKHLDPRIKEQRPDLVAQAILPDVSLGAHTASLGLAFYTGKKFPEKYHEGVFIGQHGSWNRSVPSGYKVIFIPFKQGKPVGPQEDFLTGFMINQNKNLVHGRPVGVTQLIDGSLLVADDAGHAVWHIAYK
jgi:glucose/arabinose dehydrogenase